MPIRPDGSAGTPSVYASNLGLDDFAIASDGSLFLATQVLNSVIRLFPDGSQSIVATEADGLLGDSSLAFGRTAADSQSIYVVNNGGAYEGLPGGRQPATVVRLNVGITGAIPELEAVPEPSTVSFFWAGGCVLLVFGLFKRPGKTRPRFVRPGSENEETFYKAFMLKHASPTVSLSSPLPPPACHNAPGASVFQDAQFFNPGSQLHPDRLKLS